MTAAVCVCCAAPVDGTAYACRGCASELTKRLWWAADLDPDPTIANLDRFGDRALGGDPGLPVDLRAAQRARAIRNTVSTWVRHVACERPHPLPGRWRYEPLPRGVQGPWRARWLVTGRLDAMFVWLAGQTLWLRWRPEAGEAFDDLRGAVEALTRLVDAPVPRLDLGPCGALTEAGRCAVRLSARKGARFARCRACRELYDVELRKERLLARLVDQLADATTIARALVAYGMGCTPSMLWGYAHRGRLVAHGHDANGRPVYRIGDVLDLLDDTRRGDAA